MLSQFASFLTSTEGDDLNDGDDIRNTVPSDVNELRRVIQEKETVILELMDSYERVVQEFRAVMVSAC